MEQKKRKEEIENGLGWWAGKEFWARYREMKSMLSRGVWAETKRDEEFCAAVIFLCILNQSEISNQKMLKLNFWILFKKYGIWSKGLNVFQNTILDIETKV
jgi:hypothetical protein